MKTILTYLGAAAAAVAASACCWIPALLGAGAAGTLGISAALAPWRPYLLGLTFLFLAAGFWTVYRKSKTKCCGEDGCATPAAAKRRKVNIGVMWVVAVFAFAMAAYPNLWAASARSGSAGSRLLGPTLAYRVKGMDCEACAAPIKTEVEKVPGVRAASIDFEKAELRISAAYAIPNDEAVLTAVKKAGFEAEPIKEQTR